MARNSQVQYAEALVVLAVRAHRWLDLGCGHQFVPDWVPADALSTGKAHRTVVGIDSDLPSLRCHPGPTLKVAANIERLPLAAGTFDLITAQHGAGARWRSRPVVRRGRPRAEPGDRFLVHTPNVHDYTTTLARVVPSGMRPRIAGLLLGRHPEDVYPTRYRANSLRSLSALAARHGLGGLGIERLDTVTSSAQLFRVPVARWIEDRWLNALSSGALSRFRPFWRSSRAGTRRPPAATQGARQLERLLGPPWIHSRDFARNRRAG